MKIIVPILYALFFLLMVSCNNTANHADEKQDTKHLKADTLNIKADTLSIKTENKKHVKEWLVDTQASKIDFTISNFGNEVHGSLGGLTAVIFFDEENLKSSSFNASVKVNSIKTGISKRDKDLMAEKYFNESMYNEIIFRSDEIKKSNKGYTVIGHLTIKGKKLLQQIPLSVEHKKNNTIFKSQFTIKRLDYNVGGKGPIMGKDVNVEILVATKSK